MRTLLVSGKSPVPPGLLSVVRHGSTTVDEVSADDLRTYISREGFGVDRVVFWAGAGDRDVRSLALNYATAAGSARAHTVFFVSTAPSDAIDGMTREELFLWPRDRDKLATLFISGG